jgi:serine/threonine-protein kinase
VSQDQLERLTAALTDRYRIERELGVGGMATVYLAEDLKHHRKVAVKVLRPELAAVVGAERFLKEIEVTANLQHPHILPLHDSGEADAFLYYVMPFVEGESLREKLNREKQLAVEESIEITRAVAAALDYAHRHQVIHRDIKPENILLQDGQPVVADFGIGLALSAAGGTRLTDTGLSIGTPQYMSPEQAMGDRALDARSDVYSLSVVLYEMLVGDPPYTGSTAQAILAKVLTDKAPPVTAARDTVPHHVAAVVQKGLERLPADRFASAAQFAEALADPSKVPVAVRSPAVSEGQAAHWPFWRSALPWGLTGALGVTVGVLIFSWPSPPPTVPVGPHRFVVRLTNTMELERGVPWLELSRDGTLLLMDLSEGFLVRDMADFESRFIDVAFTDNRPFFDPKGRWIAFNSGVSQALMRVPVDGGTPVPVADDIGLGGTWASDGTIVRSRERVGLWRVSAEGGPQEQLTVPDTAAGEFAHWYPQLLPDETKVLFSTYRAPIDSGRIEVLDLETRERTVALTGGQFGRYVRTGHILYQRYETMYAVPFDPGRLDVTGPAVPVLEDVAYSPGDARGGFAVSDNGTLAYVKGSVLDPERQLVWVDRDGNEEPLMAAWGRYDAPVLSPDGRRVAFMRSPGSKPDIWVYDAARRGDLTPVTRDDRMARLPVWTRDGMRIIYQVEQPAFDVFVRDWEAGTPADVLLVSGFDKYPSSISPDGTELAFHVARAIQGSRDIWIVSLEGDGKPRAFRATENDEQQAVFSSDGRWIAYQSDESGQIEIWMESYPSAGSVRRQITTTGGESPRWGAGGELFFVRGDQMVAVQIDLGSGRPGAETVLFEGSYRYRLAPWTNYDVTADGQRFLVVKERPGAEPREVLVVLNWFEELKAKLGN